jgi:quercetin dioxygenase-like cupin family protein
MDIIYESDVETIDLPGRSLQWLFTKEMNVSRRFSMNSVTIKGGNTVRPAHSHPSVEEVIYVVSGNGRVLVDEEVKPIKAGTIVFFPAQSIHMVSNTGEEDMKIICFFTPPADFDDYKFHEGIDFPPGS